MSKLLKLPASGGTAPTPVYVEDVFSTFLYTGTSSTQTINNGLALGDFPCTFTAFADSGALNQTIPTLSGSFVVVYHLNTNDNLGTCTINGSSVTPSAQQGDAYGYTHKLFIQQVTTTSTTVVTNSPSLGYVACYVFHGPTSLTVAKTFTATSGDTASTGSQSSSGFGIILLSDRDADSNPNASVNATYADDSATYFRNLAWGVNGNGSTIPSLTISGLMGGSNYQGMYCVLSATGAGTNAADLGTTNGGLVWTKDRSVGLNHSLYDTARGVYNHVATNSTAAQVYDVTGLSNFLPGGYRVVTDSKLNSSGTRYVSWSFKKQAKFFDVLTYTGNGSFDRAISHSLGSVPAFIVVRATSTTGEWCVFAKKDSGNYGSDTYSLFYLNQNTAGQGEVSTTLLGLTSTTFNIGKLNLYDSYNNCNASGVTYVAYLFANDAGGFGANGTDSVIKCGSFTVDGSGNATVNLGWEPQWILYKPVAELGNWRIWDIQRGLGINANAATLYPDASSTEGNPSPSVTISATGFSVTGIPFTGSDVAYVAIRRGPMKTPTDATTVFMPAVYTGTNVDNRLVNTTIAPDMVMIRQRNDSVISGMVVGDRVRNVSYLLTGATSAQNSDADSLMTPTSGYGRPFSAMNGFGVGNDATAKVNANTTSNNHVVHAFKRAPGFFDVATYVGNGAGSGQIINHNLKVVPELIISKATSTTSDWAVYHKDASLLSLNATTAAGYVGASGVLPTSTTFSTEIVKSAAGVEANLNGVTYIAYLFASCPGVSKVGTYTGNGSSLQVNCGFSAGARYLLIKRIDSAGGWYVFDSARGISTGNDPFIFLHNTNAENSGNDFLTSYAPGFEITISAASDININGATYIYLAIA